MSLFLLMNQIQLAETAAETAVEQGEVTLRFWELAFKGGVVMIPIVLLSIIAVYIFF